MDSPSLCVCVCPSLVKEQAFAVKKLSWEEAHLFHLHCSLKCACLLFFILPIQEKKSGSRVTQPVGTEPEQEMIHGFLCGTCFTVHLIY